MPNSRHRVILAASLLALLMLSGCGNSNYGWSWYIFDPTTPRGLSNLKILTGGLYYTFTVTIAAICLSMVLGLIVAILGLTNNRPAKAANRVYVELVRSVPLLVLLLWVYYGLPIMLGLQLSITVAGLTALAVSDSAFTAEIFRAGIQSVEKGQIEAARALGLRPAQIMRKVVLPQAIRRILPALGNQFIYVLKMSSILSYIGYSELTKKAIEQNLTLHRPLEIYTFLALEYLVVVLIFSWLVRRMEHRLAQPERA